MYQLKFNQLKQQQFQQADIFPMKEDRKAKSFSKDFCVHNKPKLEMKSHHKARVKTAMNTQRYQNDKLSNNFISKTEPAEEISMLYGNGNQCKADQIFNKTSNKLYKLNFSHHNPFLCVCADCTCGRHLCQFHAIKPGFTKNTIYKKDFLRKKPIQNRVNINSEYQRLKGPNLNLDSIYVNDFKQKKGQVERIKPEDQLTTGGPIQRITSYSSGFPGHKGANQYVKPRDNSTRGNFPFRCRSTYSNTFVGQPGKKTQWCKTPDNLRTGSNWYGSSTYSNNFKQPNPEDYAHKYTVEEKLQVNPKDSLQFGTIYQKQFRQHESGVCPAKVILTTKANGFYADTKSHFTENADFKILDPHYQTFSSSKMF